MTDGVRGVLCSEGWWKGGWSGVVILARVVGERGGEVGSVERESDDEDAELDKVAYRIVQSAKGQHDNRGTRTVSCSSSRQGQPPTSSRTSLELFVVLSGLFPLAAPAAWASAIKTRSSLARRAFSGGVIGTLQRAGGSDWRLRDLVAGAVVLEASMLSCGWC